MGAPEQSHQNLIGLCFDLQIICMKLDISAEPRRYICRYRVMTLRCETFPSALIPPHHRTEQIKPGVFCSATLLSRNVVCFGATLSGLAPPFSLLSSLPSFLFIDSKISEEAANGDQKSSDMLASICCLTLSYTFFFILVFCSLSHSLKSSSALLWANVKNPTQQRGNQTLPSVVVFIGWLHVLYVPFLSAHSLLPLHWDSIPALTVM